MQDNHIICERVDRHPVKASGINSVAGNDEVAESHNNNSKEQNKPNTLVKDHQSDTLLSVIIGVLVRNRLFI